jgi:DNA-binding FrmR family transcriptional regulator
MIVRGEKNTLKLVVEGLDCQDVKDRITALTALVKSANRDMVSQDDIYCAMTMIEEHLPQTELFAAG